jgi:hypothetical protein
MLVLLLPLLNLLPITLAKQSTAQVAEHYGAEVLSLTDAAQMIEFLSQEFNAVCFVENIVICCMHKFISSTIC